MSINLKELMRPIYKENLVLIQRVVKKGKFDKDIRDFRKFKPTREKLLKDKVLLTKLKKLVNKMISRTGLHPFFKFYLTWYILYDKFDAPGMNFDLKTKDKSIVIEFFKKPHTNDWKLAKYFVDSLFEQYPKIQKVRIDPRLADTIGRRSQVEDKKNTHHYDLIDEIWENKDLSKDRQRSQTLRKDKERIRKLDEKLGLS